MGGRHELPAGPCHSLCALPADALHALSTGALRPLSTGPVCTTAGDNAVWGRLLVNGLDFLSLVSVEITAKDAKDAKDSMAVVFCANLCTPDAVSFRNIGELRRVR